MISALLAFWAIVAFSFFFIAMRTDMRKREERARFRRNPVGYLVIHIGLACWWPLYFLQWLKEGWDKKKAEHERRS